MTPKPAAPKTESDLAREVEIRVTLPNGQPYAFNLHDVLWIDLDDPLGEIRGQAQRFGFHAFVHVEAKDALRAAQGAVKDYVSRTSPAIREQLSVTNSAGTRVAPTETSVKQAVESRAEYQKLQADVERWERVVERVGVVRESLTQRRDMLTAMSMYRAPEASAPADARAASRATYRMKHR